MSSPVTWLGKSNRHHCKQGRGFISAFEASKPSSPGSHANHTCMYSSLGRGTGQVRRTLGMPSTGFLGRDGHRAPCNRPEHFAVPTRCHHLETSSHPDGHQHHRAIGRSRTPSRNPVDSRRASSTAHFQGPAKPARECTSYSRQPVVEAWNRPAKYISRRLSKGTPARGLSHSFASRACQ